MTRIQELDGLRGIAVIMVLVAHFPMIEGAGLLNDLLYVAKKAGFGYIGVEIFFILSGYLITKILISKMRGGETGFLRAFYVKRVARLMPVVIISVIGCAIILPEHDYLFQLIGVSNYYFSFNPEPHPLRHFWSLAVEEQFYLFWPVVLLSTQLNSRRLKLVLLALVTISVATILARDLLVGTEVARDLIYRSLESRMLSLTLGCALAIYGVPIVRPVVIILIGCASLAVSAIAIVLHKAGQDLPLATVKAVTFLVVALCAFLLALSTNEWARWALCFRPLTYIGEISYGLYVYHLPVLFWLGASHMQVVGGATVSPLLAAAAVCVTVTVTLLSWYGVERPLLRLRWLASPRVSNRRKYDSSIARSV